MQQIYYTQCPIGYGLGATSGFQVKRLDPGFPTTGDFRHLGLRAFVPGTRDLAPPALRYRLDGEIAEVAWLTPRTHEYETEGGRLWGRPGGQFAHGLRLEPVELAALSHWPAGLYDRPIWVRSDPVRTQGQPPHPLVVRPENLSPAPTFESVTGIANDFRCDQLTLLLAGLARATREGRTLVVIASAADLGSLAALLTFAFPEPLRAELTFSSYHDRPEELTGFRFQGTIPAARSNRAILAGLGLVADLSTDSFEPRFEPPRWARTMAAWIHNRDRASRDAWERTGERLRRVRIPLSVAERWSDAWLDHLIGFDAQTRPPSPVPGERNGWVELVGFAKWAVKAGLSPEWTAARDPSWWRAARRVVEPTTPACAALVALVRSPEAWRLSAGSLSDGSGLVFDGAVASSWGEVVALWLENSNADEQFEVAFRLLRAAPGESRGAFLASLIRGLDCEAGGALLERLSADPTFDRRLLLPIEAARRAVVVAEEGDPGILREVIAEAFQRPEATTSTLSAIAEAIGGRSEIIEKVSPVLADVLETDATGWDFAWSWALGRRDAEGWLGPFFNRTFAHPDRREAWDALRERTPVPLRPALARVVLNIALIVEEPRKPVAGAAGMAIVDDPLTDPFRWGMDRILLTINPVDLPHDSRWPDALLKRLSGLELTRRLYLRDSKDRPLTRWLAEAAQRGEIGNVQGNRLQVARSFAHALESGDFESLRQVELPEGHAFHRGATLDLMRKYLARTSFEGVLRCLDAARHGWTVAAFEPGVPGLAGIAESLARALRNLMDRPDQWSAALGAILDRLGLRGDRGSGYEPDGLAAHIVATARGPSGEPVDVWPLRRALFQGDETWRCLAVAVETDLPGHDPDALAAGLGRWNDALVRGSAALEARFHELMLNAAVRAGPEALRLVVSIRAANLRTLDRALSFWGHPCLPATRGDLRDAFARIVPLAPLPSESFHEIHRWFRPQARDIDDPEYVVDLDPEDRWRGPDAPDESPQRYPFLSLDGWRRWRCLAGLTVVSRPGLAPAARWQSVENWFDDGLPLAELDLEDRHRFVAEAIRLLEGFDPHDLRQQRKLEGLARWLAGAGIRNVARLRDWPRDLADRTSLTIEVVRERRPLAWALGQEIQEARERSVPRAPTGSPSDKNTRG